jgi:hypothetical protein
VLGVDVPLSKIYPDREVLDALRGAAETPRDKGRVKESQLPVVFNRHKAGAYGELLKRLPSADDAADSPGATEELIIQVTNLLACAVPIDFGRMRNASLGSLARTFAELQPGKWCQVTDLPLWGKSTNDVLLIAILPELAARAKTCPAIAGMTKTMLTRRCNTAGISRDGANHVETPGGGQLRATVLSAEFVATLHTVSIRHDDLAEVLRERFGASKAAGGQGGGKKWN